MDSDSEEQSRKVKRRQIRMLKSIGRIYLTAYLSGNQKLFLESLHHNWFSFFPPANCQQPYLYSPSSDHPDEERKEIEVHSCINSCPMLILAA
jgi:hypothetical protein